MSLEFDKSHGAGGAFEAMKQGTVKPGDTVIVDGASKYVGVFGQLIDSSSSLAEKEKQKIDFFSPRNFPKAFVSFSLCFRCNFTE